MRDALAADVASGDELTVQQLDNGRGQQWMLDTHCISLASADDERLDGRASRLRWLDGRFAAPRLLLDHTDEQGRWLVTSRLAGEPADRFEALGDIQGLVELLGRSLRALHDLDTDGFPFAAGWEAVRADVERRRDRGDIDPTTLPEPYCRYDADRLVELWSEGRPTASEDLVVCHGAPTMTNFIVDGPNLSGLANVDDLRLADRHLDLAVIHRSLHETLGGESPLIFFDAYGLDPGLVQLDHYVLADMLR